MNKNPVIFKIRGVLCLKLRKCLWTFNAIVLNGRELVPSKPEIIEPIQVELASAIPYPQKRHAPFTFGVSPDCPQEHDGARSLKVGKARTEFKAVLKSCRS